MLLYDNTAKVLNWIMNFLSKIKQKLGLKPEKNGNILGRENSTKGTEDQETNSFDVIYHEAKIGLTLQPNEGKFPCVVNVVENGPSAIGGVCKGDIVVGIDGNSVMFYDDFMAIFPSLGRPVTLTFTHGFTPSSPKTTEILSDDAKEQRRIAMIKAAENRGKAWDKKVATAAVSRKKNVNTNKFHFTYT